MAKALKWTVIVAAALLISVIGGAWFVTQLVNPAQVKAAISRVATSHTHGRLDIGGELAWSLFPQIALTAGDVSYTRDDSAQPMAKIARLKLGVDFWPLLHGQVNVGDVILSGLKLNLVRNKAGHGNWENLLIEQPAPTPAEPAPSAGPLALAIAKINLNDTSVHYTDLARGTQQSLDDVTVASQSINIDGKPFPLTFSFTAKSNDPVLTTHIEASASANINRSSKKIDLGDATITVTASGAPTHGKTVTARLSFRVNANLKAHHAEIPAFKLSIANLSASGHATAIGLNTSPTISSSIAIAPFNPRKLATAVGTILPKLTDPKALTSASLGTELQYSGHAITVRTLQLKLDDSTIKGNITVHSGEKARTILAGINIDQLDLDRYRTVANETPAPTKRDGGGSQTAKTAIPAGTPLLPLPLVPGINAKLSIKAGKLTAAKLLFENAVMQVTSAGDVLHLNQFSGTLFGAPVRIDGVLDISGTLPRLNATAHIDRLPLKPLLTTVKQISWAEGALTLAANVKSTGNSAAALQRNLNGTVQFDITRPVLRGINLEHNVCQMVAAINREQLTTQWGPDTQMMAIKGDIAITNGIAHNKSLTGGLTSMDLRGKGTVNPIAGNLDYHLGIRVSSTEKQKDHACRVNKRYQKIYWPLRCHGSFATKPAKLCGIDHDALNKIIADLATKELQRKAGDKLESILQKWMK